MRRTTVGPRAILSPGLMAWTRAHRLGKKTTESNKEVLDVGSREINVNSKPRRVTVVSSLSTEN